MITRNGGWSLSTPPLGVPFEANRRSPQAVGLAGWWPSIRYGNAVRRPDLAGVWPGTPVNTALVSSADPVAGVVSGNHNSTSYISLGVLPYTASVGALTIAAWVRRSASNVTIQYGQRVGVNPFGVQVFSDGNIYIGVDLNNEGGYASAPGVATQHVCMVFDGAGSGNAGRLKLYVDGSQRTLAFFGTTPATTYAYTSTFDLGALGNGLNPSGGGYIGDVRIYNRALSAAEVFALYAPQSRWELYAPLFGRGQAAASGVAGNIFHSGIFGSGIFSEGVAA